MLPLFIWCTVGVVLRFLFTFVFNPFEVKTAVKMSILAVVLGAVAAYFASQANLAGWVLKATFVAAGFLMLYIIEKLNKIKI